MSCGAPARLRKTTRPAARMMRVFPLAWDTPPAWGEAALQDPLALLSDHAHCEMGATVSAQGMIARYPERARLVERMGALAIEELRHFGQVHRLIVGLGGVLEPIRTNRYAEALLRATRKGGEALLDRLLVSAVIERRSLERFELLAVAARQDHPELARLYLELGPSEAGHAALFIELAKSFYADGEVDRRLAYLLEMEANVIRELPCGSRIHSGPPSAVRRGC